MIRQPVGKFQRGAALVEFALVSVLLFFLLFGIVEVGLLFGDQALVGAAARESARAAAVGQPSGAARLQGMQAAVGLSLSPEAIRLERSGDGGLTWAALGDRGTGNDAGAGDLVRATVTYQHSYVTALVFSGGSKTLTAHRVMRRE